MATDQQEHATTFAGGERIAINANWEDTFDDLQSRGEFDIDINFSLMDELSEFDQWRIGVKLEMIKNLARSLSFAMLKGTVKYIDDKHSPEQWAAFENDEMMDIINYRLLRESAHVFQQEIPKDD